MNNEATSTQQQILEFIRTELVGDPSFSLQPDDDLLGSEVLDSMGAMRLISFLEQDLGCKFPAQDQTIENLQSVNAICNYLENASKVVEEK